MIELFYNKIKMMFFFFIAVRLRFQYIKTVKPSVQKTASNEQIAFISMHVIIRLPCRARQ